MKWNLGSVLLLLSTGCSTHLTVHPPGAPLPLVPAPLGSPLVIELVEMRKRGIPQSIDDSLTNRIAMDFRRTGAFANVIEPIDAHRGLPDSVRALVTLDVSEDPHTFTNGVGAFLTGLSLFLFSPLFRYDFDVELHAEVVLRTCDGWSKRFTSRSEGSLRTTLFQPEERSERTLRAGVLERSLTPLVSEISLDSELRARVEALAAAGPRPPRCAAGVR